MLAENILKPDEQWIVLDVKLLKSEDYEGVIIISDPSGYIHCYKLVR